MRIAGCVPVEAVGMRAAAVLLIFSTDCGQPFLARVREALALTTNRELKRAIGAYAREHGL